ncbi:MAG: hypothetical protein ACR2JR_12840 [Rubrobacteraceae bacterium]
MVWLLVGLTVIAALIPPLSGLAVGAVTVLYAHLSGAKRTRNVLVVGAISLFLWSVFGTGYNVDYIPS